MNNRTLIFVAVALAAVPLSGCGYLKARAARAAYGEYQNALASGDMAGARRALIALVHADEDVPDYWIELGKLQIQMGDYRGAYDAFSHAHELDRSNISVLSTLTQLALVSGNLDVANEQARTLSLIAPNSPVVTLVNGYVSFRSGELDKAASAADSVLATTPNDAYATLLKARVLIARGRMEDAIAVLEEQHRSIPKDLGAVRALVKIYRARMDWRNLARIQYDAHRLDPNDPQTALDVVEAFLRAGNVSAAAKMSARLVSAAASPQLVADSLYLWARYAPAGVSLPNGLRLGTAVSGDRRASFAEYFNRIGNPAAAVTLLAGSQLPVTHVNAKWNAVFAQSMALQGKLPEAVRLFDLVLDREPDQAQALRGRSALEARTGKTKQAIIDAQRLITMSPENGDDRLLLANAYMAAGNRNEVRRTLWQAFQDLPNDERVLSALRSVLASTEGADAERQLNDEWADRRMAELTKDLF